METIGNQGLWSLLSNSSEAEEVSCRQVREDKGHRVGSYLELATKIAELQFRNRDHVLVFRGQSEDYKTSSGTTTLRPNIFRSPPGTTRSKAKLLEAFETLLSAEQFLVDEYEDEGFLGARRLARHQILRWSILQHYEICETPLLDVTQSIRIAASFASISPSTKAYVFVLGIPNVSGAITASDEAGVQIVRLASACPPSAVRPHVQEGYLLGEYPGMIGVDQKEHYKTYEIDFGRRLVAKFRFNPRTFWGRNDAFPQIGKAALYPTKDPLVDLAKRIQRNL